MDTFINQDKYLAPLVSWMTDAVRFSGDTLDYYVDAWQRMILFTDTIRQQGTNFIDEDNKGVPPIIEFDYEIIFNGLDLDRPVNYALARITPEDGVDIDDDARPVVIIDPRAGHGPGIGGFKKESEVGIAMKNRHPVYFMIFSQFPVPGQTLGDVADAEVQFIDVVGRLHPKAEKPAVIGNCQAGWAAALLAADRPDITGPLFLNGSPLSYWAGKDVKNPMRYKGGLLGGIWASSMCADLGNGFFDGANLVKGFEDLNPSNTLWQKKYNLYSNIDSEAERFLHFEKWWNGFFFLSSKEIKFITKDLFIGNKLETGNISFQDGKNIDLKNLKEPIIVFASDGDNIAPPQQALSWVTKVWGSTEEIKRSNQVIIYLLHKDIGHLGIFVSSKVVKREHNEMIGNVDLIKYLSPGLYQMVIDDNDLNENGEFNVRFESRQIEHITDMADERGEDEFWYVSQVSDVNEAFYQSFIGPFVRSFSNGFSAEMLRRWHPLRRERYMLSDLNPTLLPAKMLAPEVRKNRITLSDQSIHRIIENAVSESIAASLGYVGAMTDVIQYHAFYNIYSSAMLPLFFGRPDQHKVESTSVPPEIKYKKWKKKAIEGGMIDGVIRGLVAMSTVKSMNDKTQLQFIKKLVESVPVFVSIDKNEIQGIIRKQIKVLKADFEHAVRTIPELVKIPEDRLVALEIFRCSVGEGEKAGPAEKKLLTMFEKTLDDRKIL